MSYLAKRLAPGEAIVEVGRFHWLQHFYAWAVLVLLGIVLVGVFIWIREMFRLGTTEFLVTDRRIVLKQGFFNVRVDEVTLGSIEGAHISQSVIGRLFNYGRLEIRGRGDTHLAFPTMANPGRFRAAAGSVRPTGAPQPAPA